MVDPGVPTHLLFCLGLVNLLPGPHGPSSPLLPHPVVLASPLLPTVGRLGSRLSWLYRCPRLLLMEPAEIMVQSCAERPANDWQVQVDPAGLGELLEQRYQTPGRPKSV